MQINAEPLILELSTPFRIAHGASTTRENVLLHLEAEHGQTAVGVAALAPYYPTRVEDVLAYAQLPELRTALDADPLYLDSILDHLPPGPSPARAAVDIALHNLWGKRLGQPLYRLWGLNPADAPVSSYTIGMAEPEAFRHKIQEAAAYPLLKLKLGSGSLVGDEAIVRIAREVTGARLCVDANAAWSVDEAAQIIPRLAEYGLDFIEQPLAQHNLDGWGALAKKLPPGMPPLLADESVHDSRDILPLAGGADGINIKLAKCGGLREARRMITLARTLDMRVMLGCMVESSVGVTAAAHLAPLLDFIDLDGNLTVTNDPYTGVGWENGTLHLPDTPGLGVRDIRP